MNQKAPVTGFDLALNYLGYKNRTEQEVFDYLVKKNISEIEIPEIIAKLKYYHYIDDAQYLTQAIRINATGNQYGRLRLKQTLKQHGLKEEILHRLDTIYTSEMETACARAQLEKALKKYQHELPSKRYQKITAMLQRRGFNYELIRELMSGIRFEDPADEPQDPEADAWALENFYIKYYRIQSRKGYTGRELKQRIIKNLLSKGYPYEQIKNILEDHPEDFEEK